MSRPHRRDSGMTLIELLVALAIVAVLLGLLLPAAQAVRASAVRAGCQNNLRQIGLALAGFHNSESRYPTGVSRSNGPTPYLNWQSRLLPYLEQRAAWERAVSAFAETPDFTRPSHPITTLVPAFACPADGRLRRANTARGRFAVTNTSYLGVAGVRNSRGDGVLHYNSRVRLVDITDGASNTAIVGERPPSRDFWQGWWYAGIGVDYRGTGDGVLGVRESTYSVDPVWSGCPGPSSFRAGRLDDECSVFHFWGFHSGGSQFLFADGSARFLDYSGAARLPAMASRAGDEAGE